MEKGHYVILSEGAYSDYTPCYFVGQRPITQEEFVLVGKKLGDEIYDWFDALPSRPETYTWSRPGGREKFDQDGKTVYSSQLEDKWQKRMREWLTEQGYTEIESDGIPELGTSYSDLPTNYNR